MKFNENTITLNLDDINRIADYMLDSHFIQNAKGHKALAESALKEFNIFYEYLESRGYYHNVKNN